MDTIAALIADAALAVEVCDPDDLEERAELVASAPWRACVEALGEHYVTPEVVEACYLGTCEDPATYAYDYFDGLGKAGDDLPCEVSGRIDWHGVADCLSSSSGITFVWLDDGCHVVDCAAG